MSHAEICPVCGGIGWFPPTLADPEQCHGCDGKGWIEVGNSDPIVVPMQPWLPYEPTVIIGSWVYKSGIYSANVKIAFRI